MDKNWLRIMKLIFWIENDQFGKYITTQIQILNEVNH